MIVIITTNKNKNNKSNSNKRTLVIVTGNLLCTLPRKSVEELVCNKTVSNVNHAELTVSTSVSMEYWKN